MSYTRVIPRDFFNEAKLLKCWGQLALKQLDGLLPEGITIEITEDGEPFEIELDDNGNLYIVNYRATVNGHEVDFYTTYNSKGAYPFHVMVGNEEFTVFNEDGSFSSDFKAHILFPSAKPISFTKIKHDSNGNPRYVCHYNDLLSEQDKADYPLLVTPIYKVNESLDARYALAVKKAKTIGGRKYSTKQFGGGIVFQSYNIHETEREIQKLLTNA